MTTVQDEAVVQNMLSHLRADIIHWIIVKVFEFEERPFSDFSIEQVCAVRGFVFDGMTRRRDRFEITVHQSGKSDQWAIPFVFEDFNK